MKTFLFISRCFVIIIFALVAFQASAATGDWKIIPTEGSTELNSISCPEPRVCYLTGGLYLSGGTGSVFKTEDGGASFSRIKIPTMNPLHGVSCVTARVCYVVGDFGTFMKTEDGGESWYEYLLGSRANRPHMAGLFALDEKTVIAIGRDGLAYRTFDSGNNWVQLSLRVTADLYAIYFTDASTGFISGNDGTLLKTEDAGQSWAVLRGLKDAGFTLTIRGDKNQNLLAVGDSIQKSADLGKTWTVVSNRNLVPPPNRAIAVADANTYYALSGANTVFKSKDSGATWDTEAIFEGAFLRDIICPSSDFCLAIGGRGQVFKLGTAPEPPTPPPPLFPIAVATTTIIATAKTETLSISEVPPASAPVVIAPAPSDTEPVKQEIKQEKKVETSEIAIFTRSLKKGFRGSDVKKLQLLLAGVAGIYPEGEATGFFGEATKKAVGKFQEQYDIAKPGEPGYGEAGPKTRAKLIDAVKGGVSLPVSASSQASEASESKKIAPLSLVKNLKKGARGDEVKKLQEALAADAELYPEGDITGYFGPATARAVGKFQEKYDIVKSGESGYGEVGPKTRATLGESR